MSAESHKKQQSRGPNWKAPRLCLDQPTLGKEGGPPPNVQSPCRQGLEFIDLAEVNLLSVGRFGDGRASRTQQYQSRHDAHFTVHASIRLSSAAWSALPQA
jgi:hypothetical protein